MFFYLQIDANKVCNVPVALPKVYIFTCLCQLFLKWTVFFPLFRRMDTFMQRLGLFIIFFLFLPLYKIKNKKKDYVTEMFQTWIKASLYFLVWDALNGNS